jgi:hypothetical protein
LHVEFGFKSSNAFTHFFDEVVFNYVFKDAVSVLLEGFEVLGHSGRIHKKILAA